MAYAYSPLAGPPSAAPALNHSYPLTTLTSAGKESFMDDFNRSPPDRIPREVGPPPSNNVIFAALLFVWKTLALPAMGVAYLGFCYACHYRIVKIGGGIADPMAHLSIIKAGVTSISILYVSISLLPLYSLISDLKSEEFFRVLSVKRAGVPLDSVNGISNPSYGFRDSLVTLCRRHASLYFTAAFFAGIVGLAASTLAPAALSVGTVLFDGDLVALSVGAINRNSVLNMTDFSQPRTSGPSRAAMDQNNQAGSIAWAEFSLGVNYSFQSPKVDQKTFIIPTPPDLSPATSARWLSDVIAIQAACEWIAPEFLSTGGPNLNFSNPGLDNKITMNLTSKHAQVLLSAGNFDSLNPTLKAMDSVWAGSLGFRGSDSIIDLNTMDDISNGVAVFSFAQCAVGCNAFRAPINVTLGSDIPTSRYTSSNGKAVDLSFLYCDPKAEIQTRHVSNDGKGSLSIGDKASTTQGNLHPGQTSLLLSYTFRKLAEAGPAMASNVSGLGNQVMFSMFFGNSSLDSTQISMQPIDRITASYSSILKSSLKPFLGGTLASTYVPARAAREFVVLSSSPPHFIASTVLYVLLTIFVLACHFRKHASSFTFFAVAARLAQSDIPPLFAELQSSGKSGPSVEDAAVSSLKKAHVLLEGEVLKLRESKDTS